MQTARTDQEGDVSLPRFFLRAAALCTGFVILVLHAGPASSMPKPRKDQWWATAWEIESKVWPLTRGRGVTVAVIDTGVEADLPELRGVVLKGKKIGLGQGDGRIDGDQELGGHGTAMAATIAAQGGHTGLVGIAPEARILPIESVAFSLAESIRYAADHGAQVINLARTGAAVKCPPQLQEAIKYAVDHDAVIVAAAGNDSTADTSTQHPSNCAGVLTVGALDSQMNVWRDSTPGLNVMAAAPGVSIGTIGKAGVYAKMDGTSFAAALTSGVVALLRARFPKLSGRQIVQRLLHTAKDVVPNGRDKHTGYGALIPYTALTAQIRTDVANPVYDGLEQTPPKKGNSATSSARPERKTSIDATNSDEITIMASSVIVCAVVGLCGYLSIRRRRGPR